MIKPLALASLIVMVVYSALAPAAEDVRACQKKCAQKMQECRTQTGMGMTNSPPADIQKANSRCASRKRTCDRACR